MAESEFFFIWLDLAPFTHIKGMRKNNTTPESGGAQFNDKWKSAHWFDRYKTDAELLRGTTAAYLR